MFENDSFMYAASASADSRPTIASKQMFGRYRIEHELGRGGVGIVYKAYDTRLKNFVALKVLIQQEKSEVLSRFLREASATAQLNHPNIVSFYEVGEEPQPYFTMEYIEGWTLVDLIKEKKVDVKFLINTMIKLCNALHVAHQQGILHRDIKPSNIMISKKGEPKITDFGLARFTQESTQDLSKTGEPIGTFRYMPPEQVKGESSTRSDVYSLGATMYEAITYRPVFQGNHINLTYQIFHAFPIPPRELNPDISPYLEAVCLKCLEKKPRKRYTDFRELATELQNLRNNKPIIARQYSSFDVLSHFFHKNKAICLSVIFIFATICAALVVTKTAYDKLKSKNAQLVIANQKTAEQKKRTEEQRQKTRDEKRKVQEERENTQKEREKLHQQQIRMQKAQNKLVGIISNALREIFMKSPKIVYSPSIRQELAKILVESSSLVPEKILTNNYNAAQEHVQANLYSQFNIPKAIEHYTNAIKIDGNYTAAYLDRGNLYLKVKNYKKALSDYNTVLQITPKYTAGYLARAKLYYRQLKDFEKALADLQTALQLNSESSKAYLYRGDIHYWQRKYQEALNDYSQSIKFDPSYARSYTSRALIYSQHLQNFDKAIKDLKTALLLDPNSSDAHFRLACIYHYTFKDYKKALAGYNKALKIEADPLFYEHRGYLFRDQQQFDKAIADWQQAIKRGSPNKNLLRKIQQIKSKK